MCSGFRHILVEHFKLAAVLAGSICAFDGVYTEENFWISIQHFEFCRGYHFYGHGNMRQLLLEAVAESMEGFDAIAGGAEFFAKGSDVNVDGSIGNFGV